MSDEKKTTVRARAIPREGFDGFYRAGRKWPSSDWSEPVEVTDEQLKQLQAERMLQVEVLPGASATSGAPAQSTHDEQAAKTPKGR